MKRSISVLLSLCILFSLSACGSGGSSPADEQTAPVELSYSVPEETCSAIRRELREYFYSFDGNSTVSVSDCDGALDIALYYVGMALRVPFPDYVNALSIRSTELAAEYGEDIYKIRVQFTGGQGKAITWDSYDGVSGDLTDTYEDALSLSGQTIEDLVERYGCMDWFYNLSGDTVQSDVKDNPPSAFGDKLDVFQGTWGNDGAWQIVVCQEAVYYVCYDKGAVVEIKERHFCFDESGRLAVAAGASPEYLFSVDDSGKLVSEKISDSLSLTNTYEKISDDTSIPAQ